MSENDHSLTTQSRLSLLQQRFIFTGIGIFLGALALLTPFWEVAEPASYVGGLLVWAALLEIVHGFRRAEKQARFSAWFSGAITLLIGTLLVNAILFQGKPLVDFILILFLVDAGRYLYLFSRDWRRGKFACNELLSGLGNATVVVLIVLFRGRGLEWVVALSGALRIFGTVYSLFTAKTGILREAAEDVVESLGLKGNPELEALAVRLGKEDAHRTPIDTGWIILFIVVLFSIHLGRMGLDRSAIGVLSPLVAVIGDVFIALCFAYGFIAPIRTIFRRITGSTLMRMLDVSKSPAEFSLHAARPPWAIAESNLTR